MTAMRTIGAAMCFCTAVLISANAHAYKGRLEKGQWEDPWTKTLDESLNATTLLQHKEAQIEKLCPGYNNNDIKRRNFWRQLMISLSWKESLHGPRNYVEFKGGTNDGLYQINPTLRTAYGCKDFDLFNPYQNIQCGVKMAQKLTERFGSFLKGAKEGMAAYWQPLRATSKLNKKNRAFILGYVQQACKTGELVYHAYKKEGFDAWDEVDTTFNTIDDLGLDPSELEPVQPRAADAPTFEFDPSTGLFIDLRP